MPLPDLSEVRAVPPQLVAAGASTDGPLSATGFLSAMDIKRHLARSGCAPATVGGIGPFVQIAAPWIGNQIHDEQLIPGDEQCSYRHEQLASSGRCPTVTI
jgi:hypothetical protein